MAVVSIHFNASAKETLRYVFEHAREGDPVDAQGCGQTLKSADADFEAVRNAFGSKRGNEAAHIIQSWSPEESKKLTPDEVNEMGTALVSRYFPGHQFVVVTHTDRPHLHNHIVVNLVHAETGKRVHNKIKHWKNLTHINDDIAREWNLSVVGSDRRERALRMSNKVRNMLKYGRFSYVFDTVQKADLARAYATSYAEYGGILKELGVGVRVEEKNITYFYSGRSVGMRGRQLGKAYDKAGLEARFKVNDERFQTSPGLRARVRGAIDKVRERPESIEREGHELNRDTSGAASVEQKKDYGYYPRVPRRESRILRTPESELAKSLIPLEALRSARESSLPDYCRRHGIKTAKNEQGETVLKNRDYVVIKENEWLNRKNRTAGSLIEFVAIHRNMTYLQAVAHINGTPRLLLLEEAFGVHRRKYSPFYLAKSDQESRPKALEKLTELLEAFKIPHRHAEPLMKSQQVQVSTSGIIRFLGREGGAGAVEFVQEEPGRWKRKDAGDHRTHFRSVRGSGRRATVYTEPLAYLRNADKHERKAGTKTDPLLVLLSPDPRAVGIFLGANPHVEHLEVVAKNPAAPSRAELDLFGTLKKRYQSLGVEVSFISPEHAGREHGVDLSR